VVRPKVFGRGETFSPPELDDVQQRVLETMRRDGIALVPFQDLFGDEQLWETLRADIAGFARHTEDNLAELQAKQKKKSYLIRRFLKSGTPFGLDDRWLGFGLSNRMLDIVNSYRGELTWMIDVDNWYTIPDPNAEDRIASQRWHRDPWDNHIVKVFIYFSDVDEEAGPFEYVRGSAEGGKYGSLWPWEEEEVYPDQTEFAAAVDESDRTTLTGPPGTIVICDTSGFHRGGFAHSRPRILSYLTYLSDAGNRRHRRKFGVDWTVGDGSLSEAARFALNADTTGRSS